MPFGENRRRGKAVPAHLRKRSVKQPSNVVSLQSRQHFGVVHTDTVLKVRFLPLPGEETPELDLSDWLHRGELGRAVADYLADWGVGHPHSTRMTRKELLGSFQSFLSLGEACGFTPTRRIGDISTQLLSMYSSWMDHKLEIIPNNSPPLSDNTKAQRYNAVAHMISAWQTSKAYSSHVRADLRIQRNLWPGRHHQVQTTEVLDRISLSKIRDAAIKEIVADQKMREGFLAALQDSKSNVPRPDLPSIVHYKDTFTKAKVVVHHFDGKLPRQDKRGEYPGLLRAMKQPYGTVREIADVLHFSPRTLVPYVVLIDLDTTFNGEGILGLSWSEVRDHPIFGSERWQLAVPKGRSRTGSGKSKAAYHRRSFATNLTSIESTVNLLKAVKRFTWLTRSLVPDKHRDRVFIFHVTKVDSYRSYESSDGSASSDKAWASELRSFISDNDLPDFTLRTLRSTGGDIVHEITGDIKAQQVALGQASMGVTFRHYRGGAARQRDEEALSRGMAWRERYVFSNGKSDTRGGSVTSGGMSGATPGFGCVDPFNPPFAPHLAGKLCAAFGGCAACPLAFIHPDDPNAYARLKQFKGRLLEARISVNPMRYLEVWAPQLARLQAFWLPSFSDSGRAGESLAIPPFPELE